MYAFRDISASIAELLRAAAWPSVVIFVLVRYRDHVGRLIDRFRKGGSAEFDPVIPQKTEPVNPLQTGASSGITALEHLRTPAVRQWEEELKKFPVVSQEPSPEKRTAIITTLAAAVGLIALFERTEASIYGSQVALLQHLNGKPLGESKDTVKRMFYDPAAARFPDVYKNYPFESYLNWLQTSYLIVVNNTMVSLRNEARDFLVWRVQQQKVPRIIG